eukprot:TRINITY_DN36208_c0_g1_i1.p1 TRINITY_DN36208_c0_g1~~TRINITY_DN36208_c0_g1_i1.p1  ORF type:complete len:110 (-),score=11.59 TRINITY_DN36208_c0_g1_i1:146-475(-)
MKLYQLFLQRWGDVDWAKHEVSSWASFQLHGIPKISSQESSKDFRWLGILDHLNKWYGATVFSPVSRALTKTPLSNSFGYKRGCCIEDCFGVLYEALCYACKWKDCRLF